MSILLADPDVTLEMVDPREAPTDELPALPITRPAPPVRREGSTRRRPCIPNRGRRRVINLAWGGGISVAAAALAYAWPAADVVLTLAVGLLP